MIARRTTIASLLLVSLFAVEGCKKKKPEEVKKDDVAKKKDIVEVPRPDDYVGELVIRDPEAFSKRAVDGAGFGTLVGPSPYEKLIESVPDENAKKAIKAIDPHGTVAGIMLAKIGPGEKPHGAVAARLKDPDIAAAALAAASKGGGNVKSWESKVLETTVYEPGTEGEIAVYGDAVLVADTREALEAAGKYIAYRATKSKLEHDLSVHVPMPKIGPALRKLGTDEWAKVKPTEFPPKIKLELDALVAPVLDVVADMGDITLDLDVDKDYIRVDDKFGAKGAFAKWLSSYPVGDAAALLSMPKGDSAALYRIADGLGPLAYAGADEAINASPLTAADKTEASKQVRILGKALGHEVGYTSKSAGTGPFAGEHMLRVELTDPAAAKGAALAIRKLAEKAAGPSHKATITPYKKFGAEGELVAIKTGSTDTYSWALKDKYLYLDLCLSCAPALFDAALDPASKDLVEGDAAAKAKISSFPSKGLTTASYGTSFLGGFASMAGAPTPKPAGAAMWGWSSIDDKQGLVGKGAVPLAFVGDMVKAWLSMAMGGLGGMGGAPPPF